MRCRVSGDILVVCIPLATFFQMLISLQKYCGIVCRRSILSGTKPLAYFVITAAWITSVFACIALRVQDIDDTQIITILKGLFFYYRFKYPILSASFSTEFYFRTGFRFCIRTYSEEYS